MEIPDEVQAQVWVLREDGQSYRNIASELGMSVTSVGRILAKDPGRLVALVRAQREDRARVYERIENKSLEALEKLLGEAYSALFTKAGNRRRRLLTKAEKELMVLGRPWAAIFRQAADSATHRSQLLSGGPTERLETAEKQVAGDMDDDQTIESAIALDLVDKLPPALRQEAERRLAMREEDGR